jgi:hypothetical protein
MEDKIKFFLQEFDSLTHKEKIVLLNDLVRKYPSHVEFAKMSEGEKHCWGGCGLSQEYFGGEEHVKEESNNRTEWKEGGGQINCG